MTDSDADTFNALTGGAKPVCDSNKCDDEASFAVIFQSHECPTDGKWWLMCNGHQTLLVSGRAQCLICRVNGHNSYLAIDQFKELR